MQFLSFRNKGERNLSSERCAMKNLDNIIEAFYKNEDNLGHVGRENVKDPILEIKKGIASGIRIIEPILQMSDNKDIVALDIGCSWGPLTFSLAESKNVKTVIGIDVELQALELAKAIKDSSFFGSNSNRKIQFIEAAAEKLPFENNHFDLIVCNTVIEHVSDIEKAVLEMYRILKPGGFIYLEAPNYIWPYEPHLNLWMFPMGPKFLVKIMAKIFRKEHVNFVDHLNFVNPFRMERIFKKHSIPYSNLYLLKLKQILVDAEYYNIVGWGRLIPFLKMADNLRMGKVIYSIVQKIGLYTSIRYKMSKEL